VNCSYWWGGWSPCTVQCGLGGWQTRQSYIQADATPGAPIPCPDRYENQSCNSWHCTGYLPGYGYYYWQMCPNATTNFSYVGGSLTGQNLDMYVFADDDNWQEYKMDTRRWTKARNWGYYYLAGSFRTQNGNGTVPLEAGKCYYFVIDYTYVGTANQNTNDWRELWFSYLLTGNPETITGSWGTGQSSATHVVASFGVTALLVFFAILSQN